VKRCNRTARTTVQLKKCIATIQGLQDGKPTTVPGSPTTTEIQVQHNSPKLLAIQMKYARESTRVKQLSGNECFNVIRAAVKHHTAANVDSIL